MRSYFATETEAAFRRCESERAVAAAERAVQGRPKNARKRWSCLPPGRSPQASLSPGSRRGSCGQWLAARDRFVTLPPHRRDTPPLPFAHRSPSAGVPSRRQTAARGRSTQLLGLILGTLGGADLARVGSPAVARPRGLPIADAPDNARRGSCRNLRQYRDRIPGQGKYRIKTGPIPVRFRSVPKVVRLAWRPREATFDACQAKVDEWVARVEQHEYRHVQGGRDVAVKASADRLRRPRLTWAGAPGGAPMSASPPVTRPVRPALTRAPQYRRSGMPVWRWPRSRPRRPLASIAPARRCARFAVSPPPQTALTAGVALKPSFQLRTAGAASQSRSLRFG